MTRAYRPAIALSFAAVLSGVALSGCGGSSDGTASTATTTAVAATAAATASASSSSASSASSSSSAATSSASSSSSSIPAGAAKAGYDLVFDEEFDSLDVSARGPGTRWIAHTPWNGDFGDAPFADPTTGFPFTTNNGILTIEARKDASGNWHSGLLASVDANGNGFAQQYGYWEMRAKLPAGNGTWPAFWLDSLVPSGSKDPSYEVDALEYYGQFPAAYIASTHVWPQDGTAATTQQQILSVTSGALISDYHVYGVSVEADWTIVYLDGVEMWRIATPASHTHKLMILVDLALGGGWPISDTPSPSDMQVDYIRAYKRTGT